MTFNISLSPFTNVGPDFLQFLQLVVLDCPLGVFPELSSVIIPQLRFSALSSFISPVLELQRGINTHIHTLKGVYHTFV